MKAKKLKTKALKNKNRLYKNVINAKEDLKRFQDLQKIKYEPKEFLKKLVRPKTSIL